MQCNSFVTRRPCLHDIYLIWDYIHEVADRNHSYLSKNGCRIFQYGKKIFLIDRISFIKKRLSLKLGTQIS